MTFNYCHTDICEIKWYIWFLWFTRFCLIGWIIVDILNEEFHLSSCYLSSLSPFLLPKFWIATLSQRSHLQSFWQWLVFQTAGYCSGPFSEQDCKRESKSYEKRPNNTHLRWTFFNLFQGCDLNKERHHSVEFLFKSWCLCKAPQQAIYAPFCLWNEAAKEA